MPNKILILENGKTFSGDGFGADGTKIAEIVFNTSMVGYQEILSDPSYCGQFVTMTLTSRCAAQSRSDAVYRIRWRSS